MSSSFRFCALKLLVCVGIHLLSSTAFAAASTTSGDASTIVADSRENSTENCVAKLSVMTYNTRQLPYIPFWNWDEVERLKRLPDTLRRPEYQADILILNEIMTHDAYKDIKSLKDVYPYITEVVRCTKHGLHPLKPHICDPFLLGSGVMALSKFPIIATHGLIYKDATPGTDDAKHMKFCGCNKGAIYVKVSVNGLMVHVVGTHAQADFVKKDGGATRVLQMRELRNWISSFEIPKDEPIILAGDINADLGTKNQRAIFDKHFVFDFVPQGFGSFSASTNWLTRADAYAAKTSLYEELYLDYVASWANHLQPIEPANMTIIKLKASEKWFWSYLRRFWELREGRVFYDGFYNDVSDHYPVVATFKFPVNASGCN